MTSIWNENFSLFTERFPKLAQILEPQIPGPLKSPDNKNGAKNQTGGAENPSGPHAQDRADFLAFLNATFPFYQFSFAKNGGITASENGLFLHSRYNPSAEAERAAQAAKDADKEIFVFAGIGLGYLAAACAKIPGAKQKAFIILEPDAPHFFAALASIGLAELFKIPKLFFAIGADAEQAASLVQFSGGFENTKIFCQRPQTAHAQKWFDDFFALAQKQQEKAQVNVNTLERFGRLWLKNGARNLGKMQELFGVNIFFGAARLGLADNSGSDKNSFQGQNATILDRANDFGLASEEALPSVLLAAGPSLELVLPHLKKIKERAVTIAVDTAVRACLAFGVQPDFIVLTDPQYWASRHIAGLSCPESILIAESAAYPSVFRFDCKQIVLMSSLFPLGKFIEERLGQKGALASGGSVATSAWDFARAIGSTEIFTAGLDLGYPKNQTHIKGSLFEERALQQGKRTAPAELQAARILFSAKNKSALDYEGNKIITDERMALFAWWFENKIASDKTTKTFCFSKKGLFIKGIDFFPLEDFFKKPSITEQKNNFFIQAQKKSLSYEKEKFEQTVRQLKSDLQKIFLLSKKGRSLCADILSGAGGANKMLCELDAIDKEILQSGAKNVAALVFPTQRQLEKIFSSQNFPQDPLQEAAAKSLVVYSELSKSIEEFLKIC